MDDLKEYRFCNRQAYSKAIELAEYNGIGYYRVHYDWYDGKNKKYKEVFIVLADADDFDGIYNIIRNKEEKDKLDLNETLINKMIDLTKEEIKTINRDKKSWHEELLKEIKKKFHTIANSIFVRK